MWRLCVIDMTRFSFHCDFGFGFVCCVFISSSSSLWRLFSNTFSAFILVTHAQMCRSDDTINSCVQCFIDETTKKHRFVAFWMVYEPEHKLLPKLWLSHCYRESEWAKTRDAHCQIEKANEDEENFYGRKVYILAKYNFFPSFSKITDNRLPKIIRLTWK